MAYDEALAERIRDRLRDEPGVSSRRMFGGLAFLTGGTITVGAFGDDLLVRVDPEQTETLLLDDGVRRFAMRGRAARGFVLVAGESLDDDVLDGWLARAGAYVATLPPRA